MTKEQESAAYYAVVPAPVRYDPDLSPSAKLLFCEITSLCRAKGYCWATNSYFTQLFNLSASTISRLISQLEFEIQGLGKAWLDPYDFISGSQYTSVKGEAGNGNERGVATARDGETVVSYGGIDFGRTGSDQIVMPIFALDSGEYPIQIWEGIPGEPDSELIGDVVYQKPSVWNVYQEETFRLQRRVKGITTISFLLRQKMHIKGFSFVRCEKAWMRLPAAGADHLYGDSFRIAGDAVEEIGNNVSLEFAEMDFGEKGTEKLTVWGRAPKGSNTVHVRFFDGNSESKQIVEFPGGDAYGEVLCRREYCGRSVPAGISLCGNRTGRSGAVYP